MIRAYFTNARSIRNKIHLLEAVVFLENLDIISIVETWAKEEDTLSLKLPEYHMFQNIRKESKGGGVMIYVRESLGAKMREDLMQIGSNQIESVWIELSNKEGNKILWGAFYRPPNSGVDYDRCMLDQIANTCKYNDVVIVGDFNLPLIDWKTEKANNSKGQLFLDTVQDSFLVQHVIEPTRNDNYLDLVFSSNGKYVARAQVGEHLGDSDHSCIRMAVDLNFGYTLSKRNVPCFWRANFERFRSELKEAFNNRPQGQNVEDKWKNIQSKICTAVGHWIPFKKKVDIIKYNPPWFGTEVRCMFKEKQHYFRLYKNTGQLEARQKYEESRRNFKRLVWSKKCEVENRLATNIDKDPKGFFRYVNCKRANKPSVGPLKNRLGNIIDDNNGMAEELNIFFSSVFLSTGRLSELFYSNSDGILNTVDFSRNKVLNAISSLKPTKAPGPDSVYPRFLIEGAEELAEAISSIFDASMRAGEVPSDWIHANVVPIFKKGDRSEPGN